MSESQEDFPAVVEEIVLSGCISRSKFKLFFNKEDKQIAKKNMKLLDIDKFAKQPFNTLSGGQKQRVLIARALCATNNIIFLDEPLSGLDPKIITDFYKIVEELHNNHITVVMISHETVESIALSSHVLFIGEESKYLSKEEFLSSDLGKQYLGD
jgi:zinc transport system ATP-binding protein